MRTNWNNDSIIKEAGKYKSIKEWVLKSRNSYSAAQKRNLIQKIIKKYNLTKIIPKPPIAIVKKWTFENILKEAKKYNSRSEWEIGDPGSYQASHRRHGKKLDEITSHMKLKGNLFRRCLYKIEIKNTKIIYIGLTLNYEKRMNYHLNSEKFKKLINLFGSKAIMTSQLTDYIDAAYAAKLEDRLIKKYKKNSYEVLNIKKGGSLGANLFKWNREKVIKDALKYNNRSSWFKNSSGAFGYAKRYNFLNLATKHMVFLNEKGKWTKENILIEGRKYIHKRK